MFLSKFVIDYHNPSARQALRNVQDFHRNLMARFQSSRQEAGVLYRLDLSKREPVVYVLSRYAPQDTGRRDMRLVGIRQMDTTISSFKTGKQYSFDICTIPCKKVVREGKKNSARIPFGLETERIEWLQRKAVAAGFQILSVQEIGQTETYGKKKEERNGIFLRGYHYQGQLIVEDEEKFQRAYCDGIGPDKAYGYGMLLLL